jgi:hypothetical protein
LTTKNKEDTVIQQISDVVAEAELEGLFIAEIKVERSLIGKSDFFVTQVKVHFLDLIEEN